MRTSTVVVIVSLMLCSSLSFGDSVESSDVEALFKTLDSLHSTEAPRVLQTDEGYIRFIGAPPGGRFIPDTGSAKSDGAENIAKGFINGHAGAFGLIDSRMDIQSMSLRTTSTRSFAKFQQTYGGLKVFGGEIVVQVDDMGGISSILSDIMRRDAEALSLTATVSSAQAKNTAIALVANSSKKLSTTLEAIASEDLLVFEPSVLGMFGSTRLVWDITVSSQDGLVKERVFVDAHNGDIPLQYSLILNSKNRQIYNAGNTYDLSRTLARSEGQAEAGDIDVDNAYDYLGDTYDFYATHHGRDSIDDMGMTMTASVHYGPPDLSNAYWSGGWMFFGDGFVVDDVTAHELTHGVTESTSNLIYWGESGAINESFSDIWGEFVDLTNGKGNDSDEVRWLMGEDLTTFRVIRNMKDPTQFSDPDRMGSVYWHDTNDWFDNGGVHINSGVANKLCYLLTDGDTFNGQTITPLGATEEDSIAMVADLFYEIQTNLLTSASNYHDLYEQIGQASINLKYTFAQRLNLQSACLAVEIVPPTSQEVLEHFRATPSVNGIGEAAILLTWDKPRSTKFSGVTLVRRSDRFPRSEADGVILLENNTSATHYVDDPLSSGTEYYYGLFADFSPELPQASYASTRAGSDQPNYLSEAFDESSPIDLENSQILFSPTGDPVAAVNSERSSSYIDYGYYTASIAENIYEFPVKREDAEGDSMSVLISEDGAIWYSLGLASFPFFGTLYDNILIAANGYIAFSNVFFGVNSNWPSLDAHFGSPRISFLFADLAPSISGEIWTRSMNDRTVITYENMPEYGTTTGTAARGNNVQVELFYSGHIRVTYLGLSVTESVVGISDGNGVPPDPTDFLAGPNIDMLLDDLSKLDLKPALTIEPVPIQFVNEGQLLEFTVTANAVDDEVPVFRAEWNGPGNAVPFNDLFNGTGLFQWQTDTNAGGIYALRITVEQGNMVAYQDITIVVFNITRRPHATNLLLRTNDPTENPAENRTVTAGAMLSAEYEYSHEDAVGDPAMFAEGQTIIYWFLNSDMVPLYTNATSVPANVTRAGQEWFFQVVPLTQTALRGEVAISPVVTIVNMPIVDSITHNGQPVTLVSAGMTITINGENLSVPGDVLFNSIEQTPIAISDTEIQVVVPVLHPGSINLVVQTAVGNKSIPNALVYVGTSPAEGEGESQDNDFFVTLLTCSGGKLNSLAWSSLAGDLLVIFAAFILLSWKAYTKAQR